MSWWERLMKKEEDDWKLGWEGNDIKRAVGAVIDMIIESIR